ncbi:hypothetical protein [Streptomyces sp. SM10]|uniref:hypothetical protein n=1 Tax=Streptomyces sp. SM10 TaxID=565556 RepID=UPI0035BBE0C2
MAESARGSSSPLKDGSAPEDVEGEIVTVTLTERNRKSTEMEFRQRGGHLTPE